jgi:hypothetical protein
VLEDVGFGRGATAEAGGGAGGACEDCGGGWGDGCGAVCCGGGAGAWYVKVLVRYAVPPLSSMSAWLIVRETVRDSLAAPSAGIRNVSTVL